MTATVMIALVRVSLTDQLTEIATLFVEFWPGSVTL